LFAKELQLMQKPPPTY